ncbi:MAG: hypothetical protein UU48_C0003G0015 [Candidatus Uhrbacteria bacterium GW2011_GWF2_41_16]|uniref:Fido domain-containing protein n=2 Tax=Candidatus Uhriibacteriota TaxID=1752732 RepID=A0A0G0VBR9_9BACT|nr:MAG: hypothetical protein UU35_C0003G0015 [Candidatus Uhrbacteria bacterium GW2011_GWC2_41_11]KKR98344.1 MAG: hypothetical protein UU48_C0003G0015 [Candidatus Uhrbacteria bacterium GW2011_GWF2_41_16]
MREVEALADRKKIDAPERDIYEVENYLKTLKYIESVVEKKQTISKRIILQIHKYVTNKTLRADVSGHYRPGPVYIAKNYRDGRREIVYTAPEAKEVAWLMNALIAWMQNNETEGIDPVIAAGIVHQEIAAIHPFVDGNGRTARALATLVLYQRGYDFRRLSAIEDYYNTDRSAYYTAINIGKNYKGRRIDFTPWLEYFVKGFKEEIDQVKHTVMNLAVKKIDTDINSQVFLDKDQIAILDFMETVGRITVTDVIDVVRCPRRTAQFHLQKLTKLKMILKIGKGRATYYILK